MNIPTPSELKHHQMRALIERKLETVANKSIREDLANDLERIYGVAAPEGELPRVGTGEWHEHPCDRDVPPNECSTAEMLRRCAKLLEKCAVPADFNVPEWTAALRSRAEIIEPKFRQHVSPAAPAHPEDTCEKCGGPNIVWFVASPLWNAYVRSAGHPEILCPLCFVKIAEAAGYGPTAWQLVPENPPDVVCKECGQSINPPADVGNECRCNTCGQNTVRDEPPAAPLTTALPQADPTGGPIVAAQGQPCKGCGKPLLSENAWMWDGCPCNSAAGCNNGLACPKCGSVRADGICQCYSGTLPPSLQRVERLLHEALTVGPERIASAPAAGEGESEQNRKDVTR